MALTHLDKNGNARMVDVGGKIPSRRTAEASASVRMKPEVLKLIRAGKVSKGDVIAASRLAGIMAAKRTDELIPLCHTLSADQIEINFKMEGNRVHLRSRVSTSGKTGVEMEALTAVSIAALTLYDMCKSMDKSMVIGPIYLESKTGGKSGDYFHKGVVELWR